ncbi:MAG TPA: hypothetical protein VMT15_17715 [Bryobacteraceae bacterium]|nr:hypothetical protein [Bryobacteraceae bacterium]
MRNKLAIAVLLVALAWGLEQVVVSPLETGAVYPEYSTLRADPMGAMALYESLARLTSVERLYKNRAQDDPGKGTTIFVLGVDPVAWSHVDSKTLEEYEKLTRNGARLVFAFLPADRRLADTGETPVERRWHIHFAYARVRAEVGEIPHETGLRMKGGAEWNTLDAASNALERPLGAGSVALIADSYPLSNEGLREAREPALIVKLAGSANRILFDENHFGVAETGSIARLLRKYHLEGAVGVLALAAILFLWRSASSLLPSRAPDEGQAVAGRDSLEGMKALLRRGIAEKDLVRVCYDEWRKTSPHAAPPDESLFNQKTAVAAYKALMEKR